MRIEIAGALSAGKSTLAGILQAQGHRILFEDLTTNPYLALRVSNPDRYDFLCQQQFVLDKIKTIRNAESTDALAIADFSIAVERAYVTHYVDHRPEWLALLMKLIDQAEAELGHPDLVVHLECAPEEQLRRIALRGRDFEKGHDVAFVRTINDLVSTQVDRLSSLGVAVGRYRTDRMDWDEIVASLMKHLPSNSVARAA